MKYFAETEKAVKLALVIDYVNYEKTKVYHVWVPKSQLAADGKPGEWITSVKVDEVKEKRDGIFDCWMDADGHGFLPSMTAKELERQAQRTSRFEAACKAYDELIERAKAAGCKVRKGMKRATIEAKLAAIA